MAKKTARGRIKCELVANEVEKLVQRFGINVFRQPLMEYLREWSQLVQEHLEHDEKFRLAREKHFKAVAKKRQCVKRENGQTPPANGWHLEHGEVFDRSGRRKTIRTWVPPSLSLTNRPGLVPDIFDPPEDRRLPRDKYVVLALIHAAVIGDMGTKLFPRDFKPADEKAFHERLAYALLVGLAKDVVDRERQFGELRLPLKEWLAETRLECERDNPPQDLGGRPTTPICDDQALLKKFEEGKFEGKWKTQAEFAIHENMSRSQLSRRLSRARDSNEFGKRSGNQRP